MNSARDTLMRQAARLATIAIAALASSGCAQYQIGARSLYRADIRTVHVPVFKSESLRPYLGEWLTEAVVKQIERDTPYKVASSADADSVLTGQIVSVRKRLLIESPNDDARDVEVDFAVQVTWIDRRGEIIMQRLVRLQDDYIPEGGQSIASAEQQLVVRLAREIVTQMQIWW